MAKNPGAKDSKGNFIDPTAAINAGLMKKNSGSVISPGKVAAKVAQKIVAKSSEKAATKVGQKVGQKIAESTKASKYPSAGGKTKSIRTEGKTTTTSSSGAKSTTPNSSKVTVTTKRLTEKQRLAIAAAQDAKRVREITRGAQAAKDASKPVIAREKIKTGTKATAAGVAAGYVVGKNSNKKKSGK